MGGATNGAGAAFSDEGQLIQLLRQIDRALITFRNGDGVKATYKNGWRGVAQAHLKGEPRVYASFGRTTVGRLRSARAAFVTQARAEFPTGFAQWSDRFNDASGQLRGNMRRLLIQANLEGWDQRTLAENLIRVPEFQFKNLPSIGPRGRNIFTMGGTLTPSDALVRRAHVIARTEMNAVSNRMHLNWTEAAGMNKFTNMNGDPVARECKEANRQEPKTRQEWARWRASNGRGGVPPRHPNCDSMLLAVPPSFETTAAAMQEAA